MDDMNELFDLVDISGQIPASFYPKMESKKWTDRKEALEIVEKATSVPSILDSEFNELVKVLKKTVAKDTNIVVVALAAKCLSQLAQGLRRNFAPYSNSCLTTIFDKFKEKKPNVISALREAADAAFVGTNLESIHEDVITFLDNKNPQIKSEMALFLSRSFSKFPSQVMNKKTLRPLINALIKTLSDMDATVRDSSAMAIGTAMKVTGEKVMMTLIADVEPIKIPKIKEFCEKAQVEELPRSVSNGTNNNVTMTAQSAHQTQPIEDEGDGEDDEDRMYEMLEAVDIAGQIPSSFYTQMESKKWSDRKEALEIVEKVTSVPKIHNSDFSELVKVLKKAVAKDTNIVVVASAAKCISQLAQGLRTHFAPYSNSCLTTIFDKFKEKKPNVISALREAADAAFVGTNLENIHEDVITFLDNKNPQIKSEMALFLARAFSKFPAQVLNKKTLRLLINALIKTLSDMDATVRDNSAMAIGTAMKVTNEKVMMTLIADVEPIKIPKIKEFCEKAQVKKIPRSVLNAMNTNTAAPAPQANHQVPPPPRNSSATMVRSTSNRRITTGGVSSKLTQKQPAAPVVPNSNATVKRNATIIKRSTVPKRSIAPPSNHVALQAAPQANNLMAPPSHVPAAVSNQVAALPTPSSPFPTPVAISTPARPVFATTMHAQSKLYKLENLDMTIFKLISNNHDDVMDSLVELEDNLSEESEPDYKSRINQLLDLICLQMIKSFDGLRSSPADMTQSHTIQKLSDLLKKLFARKELISAAKQQSIRFLLVQLFTLTQSCSRLTIQDDGVVRKNLNNLALAIMDSFEPPKIMSILTGLLNEPTPVSIVEPVKDAIIRSMRSFK